MYDSFHLNRERTLCDSKNVLFDFNLNSLHMHTTPYRITEFDAAPPIVANNKSK